METTSSHQRGSFLLLPRPSIPSFLSLLFFSYAVSVSMAATCAPYPIAMRLGNVTLSNGLVARGVEMKVGTPEQSVALIPQWKRDNFLLYGPNGYCPNLSDERWTTAGCTTFRGGVYDSAISSSSKPGTASAYGNDEDKPDTEMVADTIKLNANVTLPNYPLKVALNDWGTQGYVPMHGVGLAHNSTLLNTLNATGQIASRSFSFYWGRGWGQSQQLDGSLVLGGYDRAKTKGSKFTQALAPLGSNCESRLLVSVSDIIMNLFNGTTRSLFPKSQSTAMQVCINPISPVLMRMPLDPYFENFMSVSTDGKKTIFDMDRSVGYNWWNMRYKAANPPYTGALTFEFQSGFTTRFENDQLVMPEMYVSRATGDVTVNNTAPNLVIDSLQEVNSNDLASFGQFFAASAYIHVNYDTDEFTLWVANPTANTDLVAVDRQGNDIVNFCAAPLTNGTNGTDTTPGASTTQPPNSSSSSSLSTGAIAGIAVGGVAAGAALIAALVFFLLRRRRQNAKIQAYAAPSDRDFDGSHDHDPSMTSPRLQPPSLAGGMSSMTSPSHMSSTGATLGYDGVPELSSTGGGRTPTATNAGSPPLSGYYGAVAVAKSPVPVAQVVEKDDDQPVVRHELYG